MRSNPSKTYATPFMLWQTVNARTVEMMLASAQVIFHRSSRMALAGSSPNAADREEFALMAREKVDAGAKSMMAVSAHLFSVSQLVGVQMFSSMLRTTATMVSLVNSRTVAQLVARQGAFARALTSTGAQALSADYSKLVDKGLKPFHAAAVSNAKRLTKR